jgi:hypothetical protein
MSSGRTTPDQRQLITHMLSSLEHPCRTLTAWELGFVESVTEQFDAYRSLSEKQFETLERIYAEKTA